MNATGNNRKKRRAASLDGYTTVSELAEMAGVTPNAIHGWLRRFKRRGTDYRVRNGRLYLSPRTVDQYLNRRGVPASPPRPGDVSIYHYAKEHGIVHNRLLKACYTGKLDCIRYKKAFYANRYAIERLLENTLPNGWVWGTDAARELGITVPALYKRLRRRKLPIKLILGRGAIRREDLSKVRNVLPANTIPAVKVASKAGTTRGAVTWWMRKHGHPVYHAPYGTYMTAFVTEESAKAYLNREHKEGRRA